MITTALRWCGRDKSEAETRKTLREEKEDYSPWQGAFDRVKDKLVSDDAPGTQSLDAITYCFKEAHEQLKARSQGIGYGEMERQWAVLRMTGPGQISDAVDEYLSLVQP